MEKVKRTIACLTPQRRGRRQTSPPLHPSTHSRSLHPSVTRGMGIQCKSRIDISKSKVRENVMGVSDRKRDTRMKMADKLSPTSFFLFSFTVFLSLSLSLFSRLFFLLFYIIEQKSNKRDYLGQMYTQLIYNFLDPRVWVLRRRRQSPPRGHQPRPRRHLGPGRRREG